MTTEEKAALVEFTKKKIESLRFCLKQTAFESVRGHLEPELLMAEVALSAMTAEPVAAPEGWKIVPVEPTEEMLKLVDIGPKTYKALLAAAPNP